MINRRHLLALPLLLAAPARAAPANDALAAALVACWQARGVRFTADQVLARMGGSSGKAALLAVAGATDSADGEEVETAVEIVWEAGRPPSPTEPLLQRDLRQGLPLLLIGQNGHIWLLHALDGGAASVSDPISGHKQSLTLGEVALIGRPVIAGA